MIQLNQVGQDIVSYLQLNYKTLTILKVRVVLKVRIVRQINQGNVSIRYRVTMKLTAYFLVLYMNSIKA